LSVDRFKFDIFILAQSDGSLFEIGSLFLFEYFFIRISKVAVKFDQPAHYETTKPNNCNTQQNDSITNTTSKSINNSWVFHAVKEQNNQEIEQYKRGTNRNAVY